MFESTQGRGFETDLLMTMLNKARRKSLAPTKNLLPFGENQELRSAVFEELSDVVKSIQKVTSAPTPLEISETYKQEMSKYTMLVNEAGDIEKVIQVTNQKHAETKNRLDSIKYDQKKETDDMDSEIKRIEQKFAEVEASFANHSQQSNSQAMYLEKVLEAIKTIRQKFETNTIRVGEAGDECNDDELFEQALISLQIIQEHLRSQADDIGYSQKGVMFMESQTKSELELSDKAFELAYDDDICTSPMKRIDFPAQSSSHENSRPMKEYDSDEDEFNAEYLSREAIKDSLKCGQKLRKGGRK